MSEFTINDDGSVTIQRHTLPVSLTRGQAAANKLFFDSEVEPPQKCFKCGALAMYETGETPIAAELVMLHYACGECGMQSSEPLD